VLLITETIIEGKGEKVKVKSERGPLLFDGGSGRLPFSSPFIANL
jgi:hypothetical protein